MEKMEAKKTPPSSPLALLPDTPSGLSSAPRQMSSREMVREKVNRIKEKAAAQKAERASSSSSSRKQKEEEVVVSCYVGMPSVPDDHESEDSTGDEDEDEGKEHKRKDEEEEAGLDGRYAADDPVADIYSSTVETPAAPCGPSPYESFNRGAGEGQSVYYADAVDEELARDEHEVNSIYTEDEASIQSGEQTIYSEATGQAEATSESAEASHSREEEEEESESESDPEENKLDDTSPLSRRAQKAKNWNEEFQKLLDREPSAAKFNDLAKLAHDFVFAAETYGKIIISELSLPEPKKTIKPMAVGGQAGGEKYIVQGIFFKFALDLYGIYGGDEFAMKAASHDLKGLTHYYSCQIPGLHVPLMALIDYLGFRLIAITILPINSHTIQYGSSNAGVTVHADDPALNRMMKKAGRKMHLQGHYVGLPGAVSKKLFAPVDIEGHLGTDGRYYVVDFARTFPPERPSPQNRSRRGIVLYNLLRPELVKSNVTPLSSDAFTIWAKADLHKDQYNTDVTEATKRLIRQVIPAVAEKMNNLVKNESRAEEDLIEIIHSAGVNIRHLGYLRRRVNEKHQRDILIEMIARIVRKEVEKLLREKTRSSGIPSEEPHRVAVVGYLNKLLGRDSKSKAFWRHMKRTLQNKFARCLLDAEMAGNYDLRRGIDLHLFVKRLQSVPCIAFTEQARQDLNKAIDGISGNWADCPPDFKFLPCDLLPFPASVKHMNLIDIAEANAMFYTSLDEKGTDQARLLKLGLIKYQMAARKMPFIDADNLVTLGNLLISHARDKHNAGNKQELLGQAMIAFQTALNIHPNHASCKVGLGDALFADAKFGEAKTQYREALVLEPNHARAHLQLGRTYQELLTNSHATEEVVQGGWVETEYRKALECDPKQLESMILLGQLQFDRVSATDVGPEERELLIVETARLWERALMIDAQTTLPIFVHTVNAVNNAGWYAKYTAQRMGYVWLIAERSELLKQYLCRLLETVKAWTVVETEPQGREESVMCAILCHCPVLTDVTLRNNPRFTGESACKWLKDHKTPLHALNLSGCDQLSDALLDLLPTSVHAKSLRSLRLDGAVLLSKAALVACFTPAEDEPDRWQALDQLHLAGIPSVDPEVIETICRSCVALRDFSFLETSADDSALAHIPTDMCKVSIGGSVGIPALTTFVGSCQGLTRLSLKGLGVPYNEVFELANALPSLEEFQTTTGSTFLFTGNSPAVIRFSPQANLFQREHTDGKREILYHVHHGAAAFLRGEASTFHLRNANMHKSITDTPHSLTQATFNAHSQPGNLIRPLVPGVTRLTALFYNSSMRKVDSRPPNIISVHGGYMNITAFTEHVFNVAPHQNLTMVLALYFQLVLAK